MGTQNDLETQEDEKRGVMAACQLIMVKVVQKRGYIKIVEKDIDEALLEEWLRQRRRMQEKR